MVLWRGWYGTLKRVVRYFEHGCMVLWRGLYGTLKRVVRYFEDGGMVLWRRLYGTLKRVVLYFEEGGMILWRGWHGSLKRVVWYFEEGCMVLWRGLYGTLKRVVWYFEEGGWVVWYLIVLNEVFCFYVFQMRYHTLLSMIKWCFVYNVFVCLQYIAKYVYIHSNIYAKIYPANIYVRFLYYLLLKTLDLFYHKNLNIYILINIYFYYRLLQ